MNYGDCITIHFRRLEEYVAQGLITKGQRAEIEAYHLVKMDITKQPDPNRHTAQFPYQKPVDQ